LKAVVIAAAACAVLFGVSAASASPAANHVVFTDPTGDNQSTSTTAYASDIRQVEVTSDDTGNAKFAVTLADGDAKLVAGDELDVLIDYDRNANTGQNGFDIDLVATGHSGSATTFALCRYEAQQRSCETPTFDWAHDTQTGTGLHVVDFNVSTGVAAFDFGVIASYTPSSGSALTDIAPNSGLYSFETKADPDRDGKYGSSDSCPTVAAKGKFDKNNNGCPGPFPVIAANDVHFKGVAYPSFLQVRRVWVNVPAGSTVIFRMPGVRLTIHSKAGLAGFYVKSGATLNLRYGSKFTVQITKPAYVGAFIRGKVTQRGLQVTGHSCMTATGAGPVACSPKLKGN
jgi:hypothetical protein